MIVLDTTVLIYAAGEQHPLRGPCRDLIAAIAGERLEATTTVEVIQGFVHVRARRRDRGDAVDRGRELIRLLGPLIAPRDAELAVGLRLFRSHDRLGMSAAVLAATALSNGAAALVSADRGFADIEGLTHIDPGGPGIGSLLQR